MSIAVFGKKTFNVDLNKIYTFNGLTYSSILKTENQDVDGKKPSTYITGQGLDNISLSIPLKLQNGINPRQEWDDWQEMLAEEKPEQFILGSKPIGLNKYLLKSIQPANFVIDNSGEILALTLDLEFEEYVRPGKKPETKSGNKSKGVKPKVNAQDQIASLLMTPAEKEASKRKNPNMGG